MKKTLFITGAAGFIGRETCKQAVKAGWQVKALAHSEKSIETLQEIGAQPVVGDVYQAQAWIAEALDATAFIDLVQPKPPKHLNQKAIETMSTERQAMTRSVLAALLSLPADQRPLFIAVSGADDLQPDDQNVWPHCQRRTWWDGVSSSWTGRIRPNACCWMGPQMPWGSRGQDQSLYG